MRLQEKVEAYTVNFDPDLAQLIKSRAQYKDGHPLWRYKQWAQRELARMRKREGNAVAWTRWLQKLEDAIVPSSKYAFISSEDGSIMRKSALGPAALLRYQKQVPAMIHVHRHLVQASAPGELYTHSTAACEIAARCVFAHTETVRKWKRVFELNDGLFTLPAWGTYVRNWILDDKVRRDRVRRWLRERVVRKPKIDDTEGAFKIKHFRVWLNDVFCHPVEMRRKVTQALFMMETYSMRNKASNVVQVDNGKFLKVLPWHGHTNLA
jgi:hypothetical protein